MQGVRRGLVRRFDEGPDFRERTARVKAAKREPAKAAALPKVDKALSASHAHESPRRGIRTIDMNHPLPTIHRVFLALVA
jgi:hypothetical protein